MTPHDEQEAPANVPVLLYKVSITIQNVNLLLLNDRGRVRSQITSVVRQNDTAVRF